MLCHGKAGSNPLMLLDFGVGAPAHAVVRRAEIAAWPGHFQPILTPMRDA
jgi:hypothetical protein